MAKLTSLMATIRIKIDKNYLRLINEFPIAPIENWAHYKKAINVILKMNEPHLLLRKCFLILIQKTLEDLSIEFHR
mgnify:CR=1 FL=1